MYLEYAYGEVRNRNHITDSDNIQVHLDRAIRERETLFRSLFLYDEEMLEHVAVNKTTEGFRGKLYPDHFWVDIDQATATKDVGELARDMYKHLIEMGIPKHAIQVCFSGRGFHIYIHKKVFDLKPSSQLHKVYFGLSLKLGMICDKSIYTPLRLVRMNGTLNKKSGLYKIPLTEEEVLEMDMDDIWEAAKGQRVGFERSFYYNDDPLISTGDLYVDIAKSKKSEKVREEDGHLANRTIHACYHNIYQTLPSEGDRHHKIMTMAALAWRQGSPPGLVIAGMKNWLGDQAADFKEGEVERLVTNVFRRGYTPSCRAENFMSQLMEKHCDRSCRFYNTTGNPIVEVLSPEDIEKRYYENRKKMPLIDIASFMQEPEADTKFMQGQLMSVLGAPGRGKTAFIQNLLIANPVSTLYISLEMDAGIMFRRFCQIAYGLDKKQIEKMVDDGFMIDKTPWDHVKMVTMSLNLDEIKRVVDDHQPRIVVVDHLKLLKKESRDLYLILAKYTNEFKQLSMRNDMGFVVVSQVTREVASGKLKISMTSGSGTSSIEEDSDLLMTIDGEEDSSLRLVKVNKARDCDAIKATYRQDGKTFRFVRVTGRISLGSNMDFPIM